MLIKAGSCQAKIKRKLVGREAERMKNRPPLDDKRAARVSRLEEVIGCKMYESAAAAAAAMVAA